jgi:hypothetical protein
MYEPLIEMLKESVVADIKALPQYLTGGTKVEVKVELSLCLTKHHAMKTLGEWRYSSTHTFTSALDGGEWLASHLGRFTPGKDPRYPLDRRLCGPQS